MKTPRIVLALALPLALASIAGAQIVIRQQARPGMQAPRDRTPQRTGTATISGRVTAADTGSPLRRVQVRIQGSELRGGRTALTDADGRYFVRELPAGRFNVTAMKPGYVMMTYGQKRPTQQGTPIELADGQIVESANIALPRGGVITGRVSDDFGEPVVDARVTAMQYRWSNGRRRTMMAGRPGTTNDRGEYRIWGLSPGEYYIAATANDRMFSSPDDSLGASGDSSGYASVYYPGTGSLDEAQRVTVAPAQEIAAIDLSLMLVRTVRVMGIALTSEGRPMTSGFVTVMPRTEVEGGMMMGGAGGSLDSSGAFTISGVAPGDYMLVARGGDSTGPGGPPPEVAQATIVVGNEDLKGVVVTAAKGVRVTGRVVYEGGTPPEAADRLRVTALPMEFGGPMLMGGLASAQVTTQGTFELRGVFGKRRINVGPNPSGWTLKSVRIGGVDVIDTGYEFGKEDVSNVEILFTNRISVLTGTVKDAKGEAVTDATVLVFTADEDYWNQPNSRRVTTGRLDQNGTYRIRALPAGTYFVLAAESQPDEWGNPDLFPKLKTLATSATLGEGETQRLELRLKELPQ